MDDNLTKAFWIIVVVVLLGLVGTNIAKPIYDKISAQKAAITGVDFTGS